ncbi:M48 family metallopeptidase [Cytophagaceae bacterium ABcell3]|nr:M48 family metallopeptidase [Cytophagaceae bacterium ABcell3]
MKKVLSELSIAVLFVGGVWFLLSQVNWLSVLGMNNSEERLENQLGEIFEEYLNNEEEEVEAPAIYSPVDSLLNHLCSANDIERESIQLHVVRKDVVNAYVVPGRHMVVYTGLLAKCSSEAELAGVIGHELAHIEKKHVMKKLIRQAGLAVLVSLTAGNGGAEAAAQLMKLLSAASYSRDMEREADFTSVDYLIKADIDPEPFAELMYQFSEKDHEMPAALKYLSTHPASEERAVDIINYMQGQNCQKYPVLHPQTWDNMKVKVKDEDF